jgi:hypothetical protein
MEQIGYSLIDVSGNEVSAFGDTKGAFASAPEPLVLPNGDAVHCVRPGDQYGEWRFVERWMLDEPPSRWHAPRERSIAFDGSKVIVTVLYEDIASIVPQSVTPRQARLALYAAGLLDNVEAAVKAAGGSLQIEWEFALEVQRYSPFIASLGSSLGLSASQIDDLFRVASTL